MATRSYRLSEFSQSVPDAVRPLQVLCEDHNGTYLLPYECEWREGKWHNCHTGQPLISTVVGWRHSSSGYET